MQTPTRVAISLIAGTVIFVIGMGVVEHFFWAKCNGVDIHRYSEIWICWNFVNLLTITACIAGFSAGLVNRKRGLVLGILTAITSLVFYSFLYRSPFGTDHLETLKNGFLFFVLPCAIGCVLGARFTAGTWKQAL